MVIHTQRDGLLFTHTPTICYDSCNYGNSNIICFAQVSVRIIHSFLITNNYNIEPAFIQNNKCSQTSASCLNAIISSGDAHFA